MKKKIYIILIGMMLVSCLIFIISVKNVKAAGNTLFVGGTGGENYSKIQYAIDNATNGDLIFVYSGIYYENVVVNKTLNLIGEDKNNTIIDGSRTGDVIYVNSNWVNISKFTVTNSSNNWFDAGIHIGLGFSNNTISNLNSFNNYHGFYLSNSSQNNTISNCKVYNNTYYGICIMFSSNNNIISNCNLYNNSDGICIALSSNNNYITNCEVYNNTGGIILKFFSNNTIISKSKIYNNNDGIYLQYSSNNNTISNCKVYNNNKGIYLQYSSNNNTISNCIAYNNYNGIYLYDSSNNSNISNCKIYNNYYGIFLRLSSNNNSITNCNISNNSLYGIYLNFCKDNLIFNNNFNNTANTFDNGINIWNTTKTTGPNIIGGPYIGGNYWSDYTGEDTSDDGIGDTLLPYNSNGNIQNGGDWLPLTEIINDNIPPYITNINAQPDSQISGGYVNISCDVTDNEDVDIVKVNITDPNGDSANLTMNVGSYYLNETYVIIGTYNYFIWANDTSGNGNISTGHSFKIIAQPDNEPPEISNVNDVPDPQIIGGFLNITCDVTDNEDVDIVKVNITDPSGDSTNQTMNVGSYYLNDTYSIIGSYDYFIWANDTSGNSNTTITHTFNIEGEPDTQSPEIKNVYASPGLQESGKNVNITCEVTDNTEVDEVWANITYPDSSKDKFKMKQGSYYRNLTFTQNGTYSYYIWANDTSGNENTSNTYKFWICKDINVTEYQMGVNTTYWMDLKLTFNLTDSTNITLVEYAENPHPEDLPPNSLNKYNDIDIENWDSTVKPPINITIFYTQDELNNSGLLEEQLVGIYFWNETSENWELYNITGVNTTNQNGGYAGYVWAEAWHLTPLGIGGKENQHPNIVISSPTAGKTVSDAITITGTSSDPDGDNQIQNVQIKIDNEKWNNASGTTSWSYSWDTTTVSDGSHTIYTRAWDGKNYSDIKSVDVTVDNDEDTGGGGGGGEENPAPVADANGPYFQTVGVSVNFDGSKSSDDGTIESYKWNFGDGSTGSGVSPTHTYTQVGNYSVTLTVTDDGGISDSITTYALISGLPNMPPIKPVISGPSSGTKNILYMFTFQSTDPDNDTISYIINWGDGTNTTTDQQSNVTTTEQLHNWTAAGIYTISVIAKDEYNATSGTAELIILIDTHFCEDIGYLIDENGDGTYDKFHNNETDKKTSVGYKDGKYLINIDDDTEWEYTYSLATGLESYKETVDDEEENIILFVGLFIFVIVLLFIILILTKGKLQRITKKKKKK